VSAALRVRLCTSFEEPSKVTNLLLESNGPEELWVIEGKILLQDIIDPR
jgi:hypothetical protein